MDQRAILDQASFAALADQVARGLSHVSNQDAPGCAFIVTPVMYANGTHVVCRISQGLHGFEVSDNGEASILADSMGLTGSFAKAAVYVAARGGADYGERTFFIDRVRENQLIGAVAHVANASAQAIDRLIFTSESEKISKKRQIFETRIRSAFGPVALTNREVRGATSNWKFDAVVRRKDGGVQAVFEFIAPQYSAVASSFMKLNNLRALTDGPKAIAVLADYERTSPELRSTLSLATDEILSADEPEDHYLKAA